MISFKNLNWLLMYLVERFILEIIYEIMLVVEVVNFFLFEKLIGIFYEEYYNWSYLRRIFIR